MKALLIYCSFFWTSIGFSQAIDSISISYSEEVDAYFSSSANEALAQGTITKSQKKKQDGAIKVKGISTTCKLRLKGDWTDHVRKNRWSFRVEMNEGTIHGLRVFSLQFPETRGGLNEYFFQQALAMEGIESTDYSFVHLTVNNEDWGIVALEGHASQQEKGIALKFNEEGFWECQREHVGKEENKCVEYPIFEAASIEPFNKSEVYGEEKSRESFLKGRAILESWQMRIPSWDSMELEKFAKYYALCDVFQMYHGLQWHNQRFLYRKGKIEPIAFDCYAEGNTLIGKRYLGFFDEHYDTCYFSEQWFNYQLFSNRKFKECYFRALDKYSSTDWSLEVPFEVLNELEAKEIEERLRLRCEELQSVDSSVQLEPSYFSYWDWKNENPTGVFQYQTSFSKRPFKHVSLKARSLVNDRILITNYHLDSITILGFGTKISLEESLTPTDIASLETINYTTSQFSYLYFKGRDGGVQRIRIEIGELRKKVQLDE